MPFGGAAGVATIAWSTCAIMAAGASVAVPDTSNSHSNSTAATTHSKFHITPPWKSASHSAPSSTVVEPHSAQHSREPRKSILDRWVDRYPKHVAAGGTALLAVWVLLSVPTTILELWLAYKLPFGMWFGFLLVYLGKIIGCLISFALGRTLLRRTCHSCLSSHEYFRAFDLACTREPYAICFLARASYIPIALKNYGFAVRAAPPPYPNVPPPHLTHTPPPLTPLTPVPLAPQTLMVPAMPWMIALFSIEIFNTILLVFLGRCAWRSTAEARRPPARRAAPSPLDGFDGPDVPSPRRHPLPPALSAAGVVTGPSDNGEKTSMPIAFHILNCVLLVATAVYTWRKTKAAVAELKAEASLKPATDCEYAPVAKVVDASDTVAYAPVAKVVETA